MRSLGRFYLHILEDIVMSEFTDKRADMSYSAKPMKENGKLLGCVTRCDGAGMWCFFSDFADKLNTDMLEPNNSFKTYQASVDDRHDWYNIKLIEQGDIQNLSDTALYILKQFEKQKVDDVYLDLHFLVNDRHGDAQAIYDECKQVLAGMFFMPDLTYDFSNRDVEPPTLQHRLVITPVYSKNPIYLTEIGETKAFIDSLPE
ncbi:MAG: hypothetical protein ACI9TY_001624 [Alphaproteobacteria bacterium]|jgi:hypothetical protein